jgi:Zn-dependent M28 family amino/carboxypeptidase
MVDQKQRRLRIIIACAVMIAVILSCNFPRPPAQANECEKDGVITAMLGKTSADQYMDWVEKLSGVKPVVIGGQPAVIATRYSYAMFTGQANARAFDYVLEQVRGWVPESQIEVDEYPYTDAERTYTWKNLIVTIPGQTRPQEIVILSAHLDDVVVKEGNALVSAPGADDNAVGAAVLLEAARIFSAMKFERTIRLVWFTGEEQGDWGSRAYVADHSMAGVIGALNLDMFGYDKIGERCIELHVGTLPDSDRIGRCFQNTAKANNINFTYDYITSGATDRSDHASFWAKNVGAVLVLENLIKEDIPGGCKGFDPNPYYHRPGDTVQNINRDLAFDVARAGLATTASLGRPMRSRFPWFPWAN